MTKPMYTRLIYILHLKNIGAHRYKKVVRLMLLLLTAFWPFVQSLHGSPQLAMVLLPHSRQEDISNEQSLPYGTSQKKDMSKGYFLSHQTRDKYCLKFKENNEDWDSWNSGWSMSRCFDKSLIENPQTGVYQLRRETGILKLTGNLSETESKGEYLFTEDSGFKKYLSDNAISSRNENFLFHLFLSDVNKAYVEFLKKQYSQVDGERLMELAIHGVTYKNYEGYISLFEKYSNKKPSMQEVIEARIHGVDEEYVADIQKNGFTGLSLRKMMETKIHGVDGAYIETLRKQGFTNLTIDEILSAKIHGISPSYIKEMSSLGYKQLSLDKLMEAKIHGVDASYVEELEGAGFSHLPMNKLIEAKIHGVNADFIQEAKNKGYKVESINEYIDLKIHGLSRRANHD